MTDQEHFEKEKEETFILKRRVWVGLFLVWATMNAVGIYYLLKWYGGEG